MKDKIGASKIKPDFGENDKFKDEYFLGLLEKAYTGKLKSFMAIVKMNAIKPRTDYEPEVSGGFRRHFFEKLTKGEAMPLYVYQKEGKFIMSDDYSTYSLYKEMNAEEVPCVVIGEIIDTKDVVEVGEPFDLKELGASTEFVIEE